MARLPHFMTQKAGEVGITYTWELGDQKTLFGKMCNNDVVLDIIKYEPVKVGSNLYERTANCKEVPGVR